MSQTSSPTYLVDVVVPVYGIGPVVADTVLSIFNQQDDMFRVRCLVVVDGCPIMQTTSSIMTDLVASGMYDLQVIYQKNGGVVSARNKAIEHLLQREERADFVLFLDGDDLLGTRYLKASIEAIVNSAPPEGKTIGWAYADQFHFGDVTRWVQYPTRMWGARFAQNNFSQPSSLISMRLLEDGLRFDPQFNLGIEDWDFWCGAVRKGYVGAYVRDSYVFYRRLIGSRSSFNRSNDGLTRFRMAQKHGLDSHNFVTDGAAIFPRWGYLLATPADATVADRLKIPADVRFDPGDDPETAAALDRTVSSFLGRLSVQTRYRTDGVLDAPYTPELILTGASSEEIALDRSLLFLAEHLFEADRSLVYLELETADGAHVLATAPTRMYTPRGRIRPETASAKAVLAPDGNLQLHPGKHVRGNADGAVLSAASRALADKLMALAPQQLTRWQKWLPRDIVGTQLSRIADFYTHSLGYLPLWPWPDEADDTRRAAFVVPADGAGVDLERFAALVAQRIDAGELPYGVVLHSSAGTPAEIGDFRTRLASLIPPERTIRLYDVLPTDGQNDQVYNGLVLNWSRKRWIAYATGALSFFTSVINFGQIDITLALAQLKTARRTENVYVPNPQNHRIDEIEHLCAFLNTYGQIDTDDVSWRDEALGMGVREISLPCFIE